MDFGTLRARPDALAPAPPPLRLLQPWAPVPRHAASVAPPRGRLQRLLQGLAALAVPR